MPDLEDGDIPGARDSFARATKIADRFRDRELRTLSLLGEGRCLIYLGELAEGLSLLDEAMISVEAGEVSPIVVGDAYCTVIDGCYELFDVRRCEVWTESFTRWCDAQPDLVLYRGHCLLHRAALLQLHGKWEEGVVFAREACDRLAEPVNLLTLGARTTSRRSCTVSAATSTKPSGRTSGRIRRGATPILVWRCFDWPRAGLRPPRQPSAEPWPKPNAPSAAPGCWDPTPRPSWRVGTSTRRSLQSKS